jgi:hypothetical protein
MRPQRAGERPVMNTIQDMPRACDDGLVALAGYRLFYAQDGESVRPVILSFFLRCSDYE